MMGSKIIEIFSHSSGRGMFLRKTVGSKECISYKGLTKYPTNPANTGVLEGAITEWE